ncbi:MAG TPA: Gfo/Idh/MocA family oxidoreductase [Marinilabiliaceae bacterium]|nr:Gfo/Idh/MocA family oxidoreductase [Marinilabiliaceae bacterium]
MTIKVKWGFIGCGDVTEVKSGPAFNKIENSEVVAVMRRNGQKAEDYALRHGIARWYDNATHLINDKEVNAIYIATPPSTHAKYAIEAMQAGKPIYVEKPMATTYQECLDMNKVSKATGVPLFVAYYRRTLPGFLKVKELVEEGRVGKPLLVNIRLMRPAQKEERNNLSWRIDANTAGGGLFYDLASHQIDFMTFVFGEVVDVNGAIANMAGFYAAEDTVVANFKFSSGVLGSGMWSFVTGIESAEDTMEIIGTEGKIVFSGFGHSPIELITSKGTVSFPSLNPENIQYELIKEVVEAIQGKKLSVSTGETAAHTNWVMEQIVK